MKLQSNILNKVYFTFLSSAFTLTSCMNKPKPLEKPNIIWINCEDVSLNWGCYGDNFATTPNIDELANHGVVFDNAFSPAPISTPARSTLITGIYATSLGTQHLRSVVERPDFVKALPEILSENDYFTSNNAKTDYNFNPEGIWEYWKLDKAPWRQRKEGQAFFGMFVYGMTHEGSVNHSEQWEHNTKDLPSELFHDMEKVTLPPYYPNTKEMRKIWTHYHDNITVFDRVVGSIVKNLKVDGLLDNTIIFVFSDHGAGLPRYKRWLYDTGIHVPVIAYIPDKYKHLTDSEIGSHSNRIINFADFAPTVLSLSGIEINDKMEGIPFMGHQISEPRKFTIATRSRADNMYEMSMAIRTDKYIYIRHYHPHVPYIQPGVIFSSKKESFAEFNRLYNEGKLNALQKKIYQPKGNEELYDLENDPQELNNLADDEIYNKLITEFREKLHQWAIETRSTDLMHEADYMNYSSGSSPYEFTHSENYPIEKLLSAAEMVGFADVDQAKALLKDSSSGVRYWGIIALQALGKEAEPAINELKSLLNDSSPAVQITAAKTLCDLGKSKEALPVLGKNLRDKRPWIALYAARSIELIGETAKPLIPVMLEVMDANKKPPGQEIEYTIYKNFDFAAFTGWSLEMALNHCGEKIEITF
jgi:arylsulfatase A-like enzyme